MTRARDVIKSYDDLHWVFQKDVDHFLDLLVTDKGDLNAYIPIVVNGEERRVNIGLMTRFHDIAFGRGPIRSKEDTLQGMCHNFFGYMNAPDPADFEANVMGELKHAFFLKAGASIQATVTHQVKAYGQWVGNSVVNTYVARQLTKIQQVMGMYMLLAHGEEGHAAQGMRDWTFEMNFDKNELKFEFLD